MAVQGVVYLLHFDRKIADHAGHYIGWAHHLDARLDYHRAGQGARLTAVLRERGGDFVVARTWTGDRNLERKLKRRKEGPRLCPICQAEKRS